MASGGSPLGVCVRCWSVDGVDLGCGGSEDGGYVSVLGRHVGSNLILGCIPSELEIR